MESFPFKSTSLPKRGIRTAALIKLFFLMVLFTTGKYAAGDENYSAFFSVSAGAGAATGDSWASPCPGAAG